MKKATKFGALALATVVASSVVLASPAATAATNCTSRTTVTMLGTIKVEIQDQFMAAVKDYNNSQKCYTLKVIPGATGQTTFLQQVTPMYAAHDAPTITYALQEIPDMADKVMGWNGTHLASLVSPGLLAAAKVGGKQVGIPSTAEAFGILYNKKVIDAAGIDVSKINTLSTLQAAFDTLKAKGYNAFHFSDIWWSLGAHFMNEYFTHAATTSAGRLKVLDQMADGTRNLLTDPAWTNYINTFNLLKKYSDVAPNTQDSEYDASVSDLASGKTGFMFQGNWAEPNLLQDSPTTDFGIMPLPMTNNPADYGNDSISVGVPGYFMVDRVDSTAAQRNGAIDFLTWLYTTPAGQHHVADPAGDNGKGGMGFIPVYNGFTVQASTFMARQIATYVSQNKVLDWMNTYFPAGGQNLYGASGQQYMAGAINANTYAQQIMSAWKGQPKTWRGQSAN